MRVRIEKDKRDTKAKRRYVIWTIFKVLMAFCAAMCNLTNTIWEKIGLWELKPQQFHRGSFLLRECSILLISRSRVKIMETALLNLIFQNNLSCVKFT